MEGCLITPDEEMGIGSFSKAEYEKYAEGLDQIIIVDNDGKVCGTTDLVPEGTIEKTITLPENKRFGFVVRGDGNGKNIFEKLSKIITGKNDIEFSHIMAGEDGESGLNYITTSHTPNKEASAYKLIEIQLKFGYTLRDMNHSHSKNTIISDGDMRVKDKVKNLVPSQVNLRFNIYCVPTNEYKPY